MPSASDIDLPIRAVRAAARVSRVLERASAELTLPQYRVLAAIASGEQRASRVASRLALGRPTVSAAVEQLSQRGLVNRQGVASDQRMAELTVTSSGELLLAEVEHAMSDRITALCARTPDARATLLALAWLGEALDEVIAEQSNEPTASAVAAPTGANA